MSEVVLLSCKSVLAYFTCRDKTITSRVKLCCFMIGDTHTEEVTFIYASPIIPTAIINEPELMHTSITSVYKILPRMIDSETF